MMIYECKPCRFKTSHECDWNRHTDTQKHINNMSAIVLYDGGNKKIKEDKGFERYKEILYELRPNDLKCTGCGKVLKNRQSYSRHINSCEAYDKNARKDYLYIQNGDLQEKKDPTTNMALCVANNALKLVSQKFADAPPLEMIDDKKIEEIMYSGVPDPVKDIDNDLIKIDVSGIEDTILNAHKDNRLPQYVGDGIINIYKKSRAEDQSMWASDVSRLTYLIKTIVNKDNDTGWVRDYKGNMVISRVVNPVLMSIHNKLAEYMGDDRQMEERDTDEYLDMIIGVVDVNKSIINKTLNKRVVRYIAPYFRIEGSLDTI